MKKFTISTIATLMVFMLLLTNKVSLNAQHAEIGFRFMPTFTSFDLNTSTGGNVTASGTVGYGFGGFLGFNFNQHVGIQGEVIYSRLSQKYKEVDVERRITLNYVNIPLLLSLNTGKFSAVNFNIVAGPQIGLSVGSNVALTSGANNSVPILSVKKGDLGLAYGAGIDFGVNPAKTFRIGLGFRGVAGLLDISDNSGTATSDSYYLLDRTHLRTYSAYVGLSFLF